MASFQSDCGLCGAERWITVHPLDDAALVESLCWCGFRVRRVRLRRPWRVLLGWVGL